MNSLKQKISHLETISVRGQPYVLLAEVLSLIDAPADEPKPAVRAAVEVETQDVKKAK